MKKTPTWKASFAATYLKNSAREQKGSYQNMRRLVAYIFLINILYVPRTVNGLLAKKNLYVCQSPILQSTEQPSTNFNNYKNIFVVWERRLEITSFTKFDAKGLYLYRETTECNINVRIPCKR